MHLVRLRTSAMNRVFGLGTQWGLRLSSERLRRKDGLELLARSGMPAVWQRSIEEALAVIELLDQRITSLEQELTPIARADRDTALLVTIPGVGDLLALTLAAEIADVSRFPSPRKLVSYAGMAPGVKQSGDRSPRRAPGRCAGPQSKRPSMPGASPTPGTGSTPTSPSAAAATPPSQPSRARCSPPHGTCSPSTNRSSQAAPAAASALSRQAP